MINFLKNCVGLLVLGAIVYGVSTYYGLAQQTVGVQGASTEKAQEISQDIQTDIGKQADAAAENANQVTIGEIIGFFTRFQKIPEDLNNAKKYTEEQIGNLMKRD